MSLRTSTGSRTHPSPSPYRHDVSPLTPSMEPVAQRVLKDRPGRLLPEPVLRTAGSHGTRNGRAVAQFRRGRVPPFRSGREEGGEVANRRDTRRAHLDRQAGGLVHGGARAYQRRGRFRGQVEVLDERHEGAARTAVVTRSARGARFEEDQNERRARQETAHRAGMPVPPRRRIARPGTRRGAHRPY
jgi:hypothetical protein